MVLLLCFCIWWLHDISKITCRLVSLVPSEDFDGRLSLLILKLEMSTTGGDWRFYGLAVGAVFVLRLMVMVVVGCRECLGLCSFFFVVPYVE
jgi:hypothetical protein